MKAFKTQLSRSTAALFTALIMVLSLVPFPGLANAQQVVEPTPKPKPQPLGTPYTIKIVQDAHGEVAVIISFGAKLFEKEEEIDVLALNARLESGAGNMPSNPTIRELVTINNVIKATVWPYKISLEVADLQEADSEEVSEEVSESETTSDADTASDIDDPTVTLDANSQVRADQVITQAMQTLNRQLDLIGKPPLIEAEPNDVEDDYRADDSRFPKPKKKYNKTVVEYFIKNHDDDIGGIQIGFNRILDQGETAHTTDNIRPDVTYDASDPSSGYEHGLITLLKNIEGIEFISISSTAMVITKTALFRWDQLIPKIEAQILVYFADQGKVRRVSANPQLEVEISDYDIPTN